MNTAVCGAEMQSFSAVSTLLYFLFFTYNSAVQFEAECEFFFETDGLNMLI